jgi:hypothetical protein
VKISALAGIFFLASTTFGADAWVVQGNTVAATPVPCLWTLWTSDVLFFNTNDFPVTIQLLGTSDVPPPVPRSFTIGARQAATLNGSAAPGTVAVPLNKPPIWVDHLDVPDGVKIESRLELGMADCSASPENPIPAAFGKLSFPVIRALAPSATRQVFLGADNGASLSRVNIGVYNASTVAASAHLEVRRACDDFLLATQDVTVGPNGLSQFTLQPTPDRPACGDTRANAHANYATVTVNQPSFAYVSTLSNQPYSASPPVLHVPVAISFNQ